MKPKHDLTFTIQKKRLALEKNLEENTETSAKLEIK